MKKLVFLIAITTPFWTCFAQEQQTLVERVATLEGEVASLKGEVTALKTEVTSLKDAIAGLKLALEGQSQQIVTKSIQAENLMVNKNATLGDFRVVNGITATRVEFEHKLIDEGQEFQTPNSGFFFVGTDEFAGIRMGRVDGSGTQQKLYSANTAEDKNDSRLIPVQKNMKLRFKKGSGAPSGAKAWGVFISPVLK